jgi:hypothetical protein
LWADRAWSLLHAIVLILLGALVGQGIDYWRTFGFVASDIRGYVLSPGIFGDYVEIRLAFVNQGNRQGAVISAQPIYPFEIKEMPNAGAYIGQRAKDFSASGVPVVLNPGEIRLVTLKGKLNVETVSFYAKPVDPKGDDADPSKPDLRKQDIQLHVRALDFKGRHYDTYWPVGTVYISNKQWSGYRLPSQLNGIEIRVFDEHGYSPGSWFGPDSVPEEVLDGSNGAVSPSPSPN